MTTTTGWSATHLPSLTGHVAVVTGASSGIGLATADALAHAGAHVVLAVRHLGRGEAAAATITSARGTLEVRHLDLADLSSIREFAASWHGQLDLLINNGAAGAIQESRTIDGFETQFGTNHLGHFALTNLLLPHITDRVVTVASNAHKLSGGSINFGNPHLTGEYSPMRAYSQSKVANLLFTLELQRRLTAAGSPVRSLAAHPGWVATNLVGRSTGGLRRFALLWGNRFLAQNSADGALPTLYAAVQDLPGAAYVGPDGMGEHRGAPTLVGRTRAASDPESARRLWTISEESTGVTFPEFLTSSLEKGA